MFYLLQTILYTSVMIGIYLAFVRNSPLHSFSRLFLLTSAVLPALLPLLSLPLSATHYIQQAIPLTFGLPAIVVQTMRRTGTASTMPFWGMAYVTISLTLLCFHAWNLLRLHSLVKKGNIEVHKTYTLVRSAACGPGSFWKYIFIPGDGIDPGVLRHELAHISYRHTADLLLLKLLQAILWPNLLLYWIGRELKQVHEFQADAVAALDTRQYSSLILGAAFNTTGAPFLHLFIHHPLKRRIMMLQKKGQAFSSRAILKSGIALCIFITTAAIVQSCQKNGTRNKTQQEAKAQTAFSAGRVDEVYNIVDKMPEPSTDYAAFLAKNIVYPEAARKKGIEGRVIIKFVVDENGNVKDPVVVRSPDSAMSEEALRVVRKMPAWKPGEQNGKKVPVYFTLPIAFRLG